MKFESCINSIVQGDCLEVMKDWPDNSIDSIITDPPYGLEFMGKEWDKIGAKANNPSMKARKKIVAGESKTGNPWASERTSYGTPKRNPRCRLCGKQKFNHPQSRCVCESPQWDTESWHYNYKMQEWHEAWVTEALRIAKPGAMMLVFGGTRTVHRLTCAIEDAGWQIRDKICWVFGSGFPKSTDISKQFDKVACREQLEKELGRKPTKEELKKAWENFRKVVGKRNGTYADIRRDKVTGIAELHGGIAREKPRIESNITAPLTDLAKLWDGYGTGLKPSYENIIIAEKPLTHKELTGILAHKIRSILCQLKSYAKTAKKSSLFNLKGLDVVMSDSVLWTAVEKSNTPADLLGLMDTLQSGLEIPLSLSIGLLWLNTLAAICSQASTFTTEAAIGLTTDLKILNSLQSMLTPACLIQVATGQFGIGSNAELVASIFTAARRKLNHIPDVFVQDNAISRALASSQIGLVPNCEDIVVCMKPLDGTFAANAEVHGVAGLNIDAARIKTSEKLTFKFTEHMGSGNTFKMAESTDKKRAGTTWENTQGRWPANLILDEEAAAMLDEQSGASNSPKQTRKSCVNVQPGGDGKTMGKGWPKREIQGHGDSGGASRFFYCAKASRAERNAGLEGMEKKLASSMPGRRNADDMSQSKTDHDVTGRFCTVKQNTHPTVKPLKLMEYLCTLLKPPTENPILLDCFAGSGTTLIAAVNTGWNFVGIEKEADYVEIAKKRIEYWREQRIGQMGLFE